MWVMAHSSHASLRLLWSAQRFGCFTSLDQLETVRGIGPAMMAKLRPLVVVGGNGAKGGAAQPPAARAPTSSATR